MARTSQRRLFSRGGTDGERVRSRGATAVEYALVLALFGLGSLGAIESLEDRTRDEYAESAGGIEDLPGNGGFGGGGTVTTVPPTIPDPTTSTTIDPGPTTTIDAGSTTTIDAGSTSTTSPATSSSGVLTIWDESTPGPGSSKWKAKARVLVVKHDWLPVHGAVVTVDFDAANGSSNGGQCVTGVLGTCTVDWSHLRDKHDPVIVRIESVDAAPPWDGVVVTKTLYRP